MDIELRKKVMRRKC